MPGAGHSRPSPVATAGDSPGERRSAALDSVSGPMVLARSKKVLAAGPAETDKAERASLGVGA